MTTIPAEKVWHVCPRCRLDLGSPVVGDDHARACLFCGRQWRADEASTLSDDQRVEIIDGRIS